jgi:hypothetical protein
MGFSSVEGCPERSPSCPVSFVFAAAVEQQHGRIVFAASVMHQIQSITDSVQVKQAWVAIADSLPPSAEVSPSESPRLNEVSSAESTGSRRVEFAPQIIQQAPVVYSSAVENQRYWSFLASPAGVGCNPAGDF